MLSIFVLRTNARITPLQAVLRYRDLLQVEQLFRSAKSLMRTRPIYHSSDAAIRGHVFCSFLALILRKELDTRCRRAGYSSPIASRSTFDRRPPAKRSGVATDDGSSFPNLHANPTAILRRQPRGRSRCSRKYFLSNRRAPSAGSAAGSIFIA